MKRIDSHHHCWSISRADYHWIKPGHPTWDRDFLPSHFDPERQLAGVAKTILVQAAWTVEETNYLLGLADATDWISGVIGWVDFEDSSQLELISRFSNHPKLLGLRPLVQEIPQLDWVLRDDVDWAYRAITERSLVFEALGFARHTKVFLELFKRHPEMRTVIDHGMKPEIAAGRFDEWAKDMAEIAKSTDVYCKLSGLLTEAKPGATSEDLRPYVDHLLETFGPDRLMWGSDWPVLNDASNYQKWVDMVEVLIADLSPEDKQKIWAGTASKFYRLGED